MALHVYSAAPRTSMAAWQRFIASKQRSFVCVAGDYSHSWSSMKRIDKEAQSLKFRIMSSLDATAAVVVAEVGRVTEVNKDTFWPILEAAAVVVDMYTQWCGPCKVMAPKFQQLSEKYTDVVFLKLDCNNENRPLAKELGIKVVPTFKIFKDSKIVKEVTGAKFDDLVLAIENARSI